MGESDRRLRRNEVALSAGGTFASDFFLPAEMPEGSYKIRVIDQAGHRQTTDFHVVAAADEHLRLLLDLPRSVYYRGETIEGSLRAVLPQDLPLAGVKVQYKLNDAPSTAAITAKTDARGEVHFAIPTGELDSYGTLTFAASIPSRSVSVQRPLTVATQSYSIELEANRDLYLADEAFEIRVKTTNAASRPCAEKVSLKVFRKERVGQMEHEELAAECPLATADDGTARHTLKLAKGGAYVARASGTDRFGNAIAADLSWTVSGDDDPRRLLLLVDRPELKAGDTAEAEVVWRGKPAVGVVACHYDRLVERRQIALKTGLNRLSMPVTAAMAPGFTLAVSVMDDRAIQVRHDGRKPSQADQHALPHSEREDYLHEATCSLSVDPDLQVKIECHRHGDAAASPQPGEPADITVTTCNAQGKPVAAEVGLAVLPYDAEFNSLAPTNR